MCWGKKSDQNTNDAPFTAHNVGVASRNRAAIEAGGTGSVGGWRGRDGQPIGGTTGAPAPTPQAPTAGTLQPTPTSGEITRPTLLGQTQRI